jgi:plasmid stabilization system protein ParE
VSAYVLNRAADLDLDEIWEYIAQDNVDAADRWIGKLFDAFDALALNPVWDTLATILRRIPFFSGW